MIRPNESTDLTADDFARFIERGAGQLTAREVQKLVSDLPNLRDQFRSFRDSAFPETERQLHFLSHIVEQIWTDVYRDAPYQAAIEAAFALIYFTREADIIPDSLGPIGLTDDSAVVKTVLARNAPAYELFRAGTKLDWADFPLTADRT